LTLDVRDVAAVVSLLRGLLFHFYFFKNAKAF
jgi:hypothetical protein